MLQALGVRLAYHRPDPCQSCATQISPVGSLLPGPRPYEACLTEEDTGNAVAVDDPFVVVLALTYPFSRSDMIRLPGVVQLGLHVLSPSLPIGP